MLFQIWLTFFLSFKSFESYDFVKVFLKEVSYAKLQRVILGNIYIQCCFNIINIVLI